MKKYKSLIVWNRVKTYCLFWTGCYVFQTINPNGWGVVCACTVFYSSVNFNISFQCKAPLSSTWFIILTFRVEFHPIVSIIVNHFDEANWSNNFWNQVHFILINVDSKTTTSIKFARLRLKEIYLTSDNCKC